MGSRGPTKPKAWQELVQTEPVGGDKRGLGGNETMWANDTYIVFVRTIFWPGDAGELAGKQGWHLSYRRRDRKPARSWRDVQRIKNQLCSPWAEGVELYPDEERKVDDANQYHLYVLPIGFRWPFGSTDRSVTDYHGLHPDGWVQTQLDGADKLYGYVNEVDHER